ncbi:hypothetical protein P353_10470 [Comamonas testosteroni]|uniref:Uncharacterized protein n=1 Tax=Comamonas testosteroni TaxID=285 RepID=A0A096FLG7_COMTE|nr:hypothetical protein P353_10470 [Comamonas testosteroni]
MPATMVMRPALHAHIELRPTHSPHQCRSFVRLGASVGERYCEPSDAGTKPFDKHVQRSETETNDLVTDLFELDFKETRKRLGETL